MKGVIISLLVVCAAVSRAQKDACPPEQETNWEIETLLRHEDCDKFYKCTFGQPIVYQCPADLYFNLDTWECDWRHNVDCTDRYVPGEDPTTLAPAGTTEPATVEPTSTTTTTTTPVPTTTTTTTTPVPTTTTTTTPVPTTTTTTTTTPLPTTTTTTTPVPTTTTTTTTTPAPTTTTSTTTTPAPTTTTSTTPVPTTTTTSTTTTPVPTTTTTSTSTTTTPVPTTPESATTPAPTVEDEEIEFLENGCPVNPHIHWLLPHEEDCNLFYYCVWGEKVLRQCPSGLHFNTKIQVCDWQWDAGCTLSLNKHLEYRQKLRTL